MEKHYTLAEVGARQPKPITEDGVRYWVTHGLSGVKLPQTWQGNTAVIKASDLDQFYKQVAAAKLAKREATRAAREAKRAARA